VIGDRPLVELVPLYRDPKSNTPATQFNMKWVEAAGLVKFDFLGLKTLTVIDTAVKLLSARGVEIDIHTIPLDDPAPYEMISHGDTVGVGGWRLTDFTEILDHIHTRLARMEETIESIALLIPPYQFWRYIPCAILCHKLTSRLPSDGKIYGKNR